MGFITLEFNSGVKAESLKDATLSAKNKTFKLISVPGQTEAGTFNFSGTLEPETEYTVFVPAVKDIDGRELSNRKKFPLKIKTGRFPA